MQARGKLSSKCQIVIPKHVREVQPRILWDACHQVARLPAGATLARQQLSLQARRAGI